MKTIVIAGKNDIAVNVLNELLKYREKYKLLIVCNKNETGKNGWQRSLRLFAFQNKIEEVVLEQVYDIEDLLFLSLEFDQIVRPNKFKTNKLYNIHFSLLPAYKGMYTSIMPILNGEKKAGVTFHKIERGIDTGDIIYQKKFDISSLNAKQLYLKFIEYGTSIILENLEDIISTNFSLKKQKIENSTYYSKDTIDFENLSVDINQTAYSIGRQISAFVFRNYQLPSLYGHKIFDYKILKNKSFKKPGTILFEDKNKMVISTIDYEIELYYDRFEELLHYCAIGDINGVREILSYLNYMEEKNVNGWTPLIVATYHNQKNIVDFLLSLGANVRVKNNNGTNLLMYAKDAFLTYGDDYLIKLYLDLGISPLEEDYAGHNLYFYYNEFASKFNND